MLYNRIYNILTAKWLIHQDVIHSFLPVLISFLKGNPLTLADFSEEKKPYAVSINTVDRWNLDDLSVPENSVAIIPIDGVMTSWKSMRIENDIRTAENNQNIIAILFLFSTPGGMVSYTDILANVIKNSPLPSVGFVLEMTASAGMWLISGTDRIILSSELDMMGSIGVMASWTDYTRLLKDKLGIDEYQFYATMSTRKNEVFRALKDAGTSLEDKQALIVPELDYINEFFHRAIQENLGISKDSEVFSGADYYGKRAIELGLAHEIGSFETALQAAHQLGLKTRIQSFINQNKH